jgi:hypothetical protein
MTVGGRNISEILERAKPMAWRNLARERWSRRPSLTAVVLIVAAFALVIWALFWRF